MRTSGERPQSLRLDFCSPGRCGRRAAATCVLRSPDLVWSGSQRPPNATPHQPAPQTALHDGQAGVAAPPGLAIGAAAAARGARGEGRPTDGGGSGRPDAPLSCRSVGLRPRSECEGECSWCMRVCPRGFSVFSFFRRRPPTGLCN